MDKKALRKELENALSKSINDTLNKRNALATAEIKKKIEDVSKIVAKKFYKAIKELSKKKVVPAKAIEKKAAKVKKTPAKKTKVSALPKNKK
jgi:hypothetical protein